MLFVVCKLYVSKVDFFFKLISYCLRGFGLITRRLECC